MKTELQEQLFKRYPGIFVQRHLPKTETAMCYGINCPDHWYDLIDMLCHHIQIYVINYNKNNNDQLKCEATQVKQKFGGLRFYVSNETDYIKGLINMTESVSRIIKGA
jgi:hypothetical protein